MSYPENAGVSVVLRTPTVTTAPPESNARRACSPTSMCRAAPFGQVGTAQLQAVNTNWRFVMRMTQGALGFLCKRYAAVLKKCRLLNVFGSLAVAGMLVMGGAGVAGRLQWTFPL